MSESVRVLVVDDSADTASVIAEHLKMDGYVVETANDGAAALALVQQVQPHCVLFDVAMPEMDGLELARHLRAQFANDVVLIAVTGYARNSERVKATFELADHYLEKPVNFSELRKVLRPLI